MVMKKDEIGAVKMYSDLANEYHSMREKKSFYNEFVEMPAMMRMLGNIKNKKILDWGCGSGLYINKLKSKCKAIKGFDISPEMVEIARGLNPKQDIRIGSGTKIPFKEKFDIVFASLSIHYLKNLNPVFKEIKRVLKSGGVLIFSTGNPLAKAAEKKKINGIEYKILGEKDYFKLNKTEMIYNSKGGKKIKIFNYVIKNKQVINLANKFGFDIIDYEDTKPILSAKKQFPKEYKLYSKLPLFSVWKLRLK